jgi:hypothetical protein
MPSNIRQDFQPSVVHQVQGVLIKFLLFDEYSKVRDTRNVHPIYRSPWLSSSLSTPDNKEHCSTDLHRK